MKEIKKLWTAISTLWQLITALMDSNFYIITAQQCTNSIGWILVTRKLFRITRINQYTTTKLSRRYLVTAYKFGNGGIELSQVFLEYLAVHKAHAFKYLKGRKNERAL